MKKLMHVLGIMLAIIMILSIISGCSGSKTSNNAPSTSSSAPSGTDSAPVEKKPVTLRFMWWGSDTRHNNTLAMIELYQTANTHVTVEAEYGGWDGYQDKLTTQLAGGTAPDLMQVSYSWVNDLQKKGGFFADLSKYPQLMDLSMFSANMIDSFCKVDDAVVATPAGASAFAFLVNKETLTKAGVPLGQKWTWDSFLDAAKKVRALGNDYYLTPDGGKETLYQKYLRPYVIARTGNVWINDDYTMGFSRDNLVEALSYIKTLNDNEAWPPVTEIGSSASLTEDPKWLNGTIAATLGGWVSSFYPSAEAIGDAADVEIFPTLSGGKDTAIASQASMMLCVNAKNPNVEETISFLNYMFTDKEALTTLADCRGVPSSKQGIEVAESSKFLNPMVTKCLKLALDNNTSVPYSSISDDSELSTAGQDVIEMMLFGQLTPEAAADEMISRFEVRLAEMKAGN